MKKTEKVLFVEDLTVRLKSAKSVVLVNYSGLTVAAQQELKKRLKEANASLVVVKNTLLKRAGDASRISDKVLTDTVLSGQTALVIATGDPVAPIGILGKFAKEFATPKFKVGVIEGEFSDEASLIALSVFPSKDVLWGQLLGLLMSPSYGLVGTLNGNLQKLVYILNAKVKS